MYLIMGRTGSGKNYMANLLQGNGMKRVISRTTRPKRDNEDKEDYIWRSKEDAKKEKKRPVAQTKIGEYEYYTLAKDLAGKDMYIIDPKGMYDLTKNTPNVDYHIIYLRTHDKDERKKHTVMREKDKNKAIEEFERRDKAEDKQFSNFEKIIDTESQDMYKDLPRNIQAVHILENDYTPEAKLSEWAMRLANDKTMLERLSGMVRKAGLLNILQMDPNGLLKAQLTDVKTKTTNTAYITAEEYAESLMRNARSFDNFIVTMLIHDRDLDSIYPYNR